MPKTKITSAVGKNILKLSSANVLAQAFSILVLPILSRLFTPEQFGSMSLFVSVAGILTIVMTLRFEHAIILSPYKKESQILKLLALLLSTGFALLTCLVLVLLLFFETEWFVQFNEEVSGTILLIPIAALIHCYYKIHFNQLNRDLKYGSISILSVLFSVFQSCTKLLFGLLALKNGLLLGILFGRFLSILYFQKSLWSGWGKYSNKKSLRLFYYVANKYSSYPKFLLISDVINAFALQLPFFLILYYFDKLNVGYFSLAYSVTSVPLTFLGNAISTVFRRESAISYAQTGGCETIFKKFFKYTVLVTLPIFIALFFISPSIFPLVFGPDWALSGTIVQLLCMLFFFQFLARILSYVFILKNKQLENLFVQVLLLLSIFLAFYFAKNFALSFESTIFAYSLVYSTIYIYVITRSYFHSKRQQDGYDI